MRIGFLVVFLLAVESASGADRHWAYRPVRKPGIPSVADAGWPLSPIDNFILARLEAKGWKPAEEVSPRVLLRRVYLDVLGMPPTLEEQNRFLNDTSPNAFEKLIDDLLTRPGFGERWGRHWLDLVRYAETNGYERDAIKPHAWRYRDYVIDSLNADKPYDRFVLEQLAGDELPDRSSETVIATGYYRLGPWDDEPADPKQDRFDQLDDLVRTTSRAFLGTTLGCCRCHDHKFDPLTMKDYYRMVAVFAPLDRPRNVRMELDLPAGSLTELAAVAKRDREIRRLESTIAETRAAFRLSYLRSGKSRLPRDAVAAFLTSPNKRTSQQQEHVRRNEPALEQEIDRALPARLRAQQSSSEKRIRELRRRRPDLPRGYFLRETGSPPPQIHILQRGRAATPGSKVEPGVPVALTDSQPSFLKPNAGSTRRRLTLARWITSPDHPLTARVIVNRVWQFHFGEGLVPSASDFGTIGVRPSHPQLLDWLAHWFVHDARWSLKKLHRLILTSRTYRMSKKSHPRYHKADPENLLWWRFPYRRLEVEVIRDSMLAVSGQLNRKMRGPSTYLSVPKAALSGHSDPGKIWKPLDEQEASRRTVYAFIKRSLVVPMLEVLDLCDSTRSSERRQVTSVPTQALTLLNGEFVNRQTRHFANRVRREAGSNPQQQIDRAIRLALSRPSSEKERRMMGAFLQRETEKVRRENRNAQTDAECIALQRLCRVIFNLNEFVYPD